MDSETLVKEVKPVIQRLSDERGKFRLAMLAAPGDAIAPYEQWNLVVSAGWLDKETRLKVRIEIILAALRKGMSYETRRSIMEVSPLPPDHPVVHKVNSIMSVGRGPKIGRPRRMDETTIAHYPVLEAFVFVSDRNAGASGDSAPEAKPKTPKRQPSKRSPRPSSLKQSKQRAAAASTKKP